jgi:hypothetical protein
MTVLGVRCSNRDFTYAILDGTKQEPQQIEVATLSYPKGFAKPQSLHWLFQEAEGLLQRHQVDKIVLKRFEGQSRGTPFEERVEHEAAVILAAAKRGMRAVFKKVKSQIAKDLGQKGRARYLAELDASKLPAYENLREKEKEAVQAAWSELA